jgi:O-antigen ligase
MPGALVVGLSFWAGGFFPDATAAAAAGVAVLLAVRVTAAQRPLGGLSAPVAVVAGSLALLAAWTLASAWWSGAPARALLEFDRVLLYLLVFLLFGLRVRSHTEMRWLVRAVGLGMVVVCLAAFASRTLPDLLPTAPNLEDARLSYPLTYWNALGLVAALAIVLSLHLSSSRREPAAVRVLGAAALPLLCSTLLLTFSRGGIVVAGLGLLAYALLARPRLLATALVAAVPPSAIALSATFGAERLAAPDFRLPAAAAQGAELAALVGLCVLGAAVLRALLLLADRPISALRFAPRTRRALLAATAAAVAAAAVIVAAQVDLGAQVERQYQRFLVGRDVGGEGELRARLSDTGNNGRLDMWRVALASWREHPVAGTGAGTYPLTWESERPYLLQIEDAHSLYLEVPSELGVVGLALVGLALATLLAVLAVRCRGPDRSVYAAVLAAGLVWAVHAGIDWDWEMPGATVWLFALGGAALAALPRTVSPPERATPAAPATARAAPPGRSGTGLAARLRSGRSARSRESGVAGTGRLLAGLACLALGLTPALVYVSERRLDRATDAFVRGDCPAAIAAALDSTEALDQRPEPFELLGYCDVQLGYGGLAIPAMERAVRLDPRSWETHYALAVARAAEGLDPRAAIGAADRLNPQSPLVGNLAQRLGRTRTPAGWRRAVRGARLPVAEPGEVRRPRP